MPAKPAHKLVDSQLGKFCEGRENDGKEGKKGEGNVHNKKVEEFVVATTVERKG